MSTATTVAADAKAQVRFRACARCDTPGACIEHGTGEFCRSAELPPPAALITTEPLTWHPAAGTKLPDADATCLLWIRYSDGTEDWEAGWLDGDGWRLCESGGLVDGEVLFWAMPGGPRA